MCGFDAKAVRVSVCEFEDEGEILSRVTFILTVILYQSILVSK